MCYICKYIFLLIVKDISMLSMVSKTISQHIINYISTSSGSKRLLLPDFHNLELPEWKQESAILEYYRSLGNLSNVMRIVTSKNYTQLRDTIYNSVRPVGNGVFPISVMLLLFSVRTFFTNPLEFQFWLSGNKPDQYP